MPLVVADGPLLEEILDLTYPLWHEGLTRRAYGQWNAAQMRTPWGRSHLARIALVDEAGTLLATAKRYRLRASLDGRDVGVLGIGAVFTPVPHRGRGHASRLLEMLASDAARDGDALAMLFSQINPAFYERVGFRPLQLDQVRLTVHEKGGGAPAMLVRTGHESDLAAVMSMHEVRATGARLALQRPVDLVKFMLARKRLLAGFGSPGLRQVEFHVVEEGATAVAYALISVDGNGWTLNEAGDRDPAGARLGALLQVLIAREPSRHRPMIRAWWPRALPVPPQLQLTDRHDASEVLMIRPLRELSLPASGEDVFYWRSDFF
jgi:GNAT superfamily N-acetyltransferase